MNGLVIDIREGKKMASQLLRKEYLRAVKYEEKTKTEILFDGNSQKRMRKAVEIKAEISRKLMRYEG